MKDIRDKRREDAFEYLLKMIISLLMCLRMIRAMKDIPLRINAKNHQRANI